ncbi:MAG: vWA domain-containing protein [Gammaproteobacteria bacterium]|jgi:uncharacterized protein with von Willebrand factor type A (vWA) domain
MNNTQFSKRISNFVQHLRDNGHTIGIKELADSMQIISESKQLDKTLSKHCLRSLCCRNKEEWQHFDHLFDTYWYQQEVEETTNTKKINTPVINKGGGLLSGMAGTTSFFETLSESAGKGGGKQKTISKADFRFLNNHHAMREAEALAEKLAIQLKARTRVHRKTQSSGNRMELRHTLRRSMTSGGVPLKPIFSVQYKKQPHLVLLHDVSHSMNWNNPLLFRFARGLIRACPDSEAFVFHTNLFCVTDIYREKSITQMREKLESNNHLWLGGTCIAESLEFFNKQHAQAALRKDSVVIIISDGFDTDAPDCLVKQLKKIKNKCKQILWLNPMLGREGITVEDDETMMAAKPYIDQFAAAHSVDALRNVIYKIRLK